MGDNYEEIRNQPMIDSKSEKSEILEKLNLQEQKIDKMAEKLQSMEKSIAKISKFDDDEKMTMMKFEKQLESLEKSILLNNQNKRELKSEKKFVMKHIFENVTNLEEGKWYISEEEEHFNVKCSIQIERQKSSHFELVIFCEPVAPVGKEWSIETIETKLEFRLMGNDDNNVIKTMKFCFDPGNQWTSLDFLKWEEIKEDYLIDDKLSVEVIVEILKMSGSGKENLRNFDESVEEYSDVVLVVKDRKFYLCKMFLALQSTYFKSLLLGKFKESRKNKIELKDIDPDDFQNFLELIHGESSVNDDTVSGILHLADMYDAPSATRKCEEFLLEKSKKSAKKLLEMVARYNLENLKKKRMSEIKTVADIRAVLPSDINDLDSRIMAELLEKSLSFH
ncbi:unnamed protein product [Caenorhabditis nigoni]